MISRREVVSSSLLAIPLVTADGCKGGYGNAETGVPLGAPWLCIPFSALPWLCEGVLLFLRRFTGRVCALKCALLAAGRLLCVGFF